MSGAHPTLPSNSEWCDPNNPPIAEELRQRWENGEHERTRFLTIGLSLAGNVNASERIRPLRFLITDGSRLGYDIHTTYETGHNQQKRAYDHSRFKQVLEGRGVICESQAEYERQVARYLFGFNDVKDFQKLINLLLVLRRPNLSSELNFSKVHEYLKQSLRKISSETTNRVIGTIERIDAIQSEIERIQEAYDATERLHRAQQSLVLSRTQIAACGYVAAQLTEDTLQNRVSRLRQDLSHANNEHTQAQTRSQTLQIEQAQANGQIKALEASEGLQVAKQLATARERVRETEAQRQLQEQSLQVARYSLQTNAKNLQRQHLRFEKMKTESLTQLQELHSIAAEECYWELAAFQLEEALRQITTISTEAPSAPEVPPGITTLLSIQSEERLTWLCHLEELHQQREKLETKVQNARSLETTRFQELDEARRRFQSARDRAYTAQQNLTKTLEQFIITSEAVTSFSSLSTIDEYIQQQTEIVDDESLPGSIVEQFTATLQGYRQIIETLENELTSIADQIQGELNELQLLTGSKNHEVSELEAIYEQKLSEPEFTPQRSPRHTMARAKLAEQGIHALPLYALLDLAPGVDSEEAGRIEYMLEDAGLLDALVIASEQAAAADALLVAEGLSDCRLDITTISRSTGDLQKMQASLQHKLCFDTSVNDEQYGDNQSWEATTTAILTAIGYHTKTGETLCAMNEDGTWTHGLLTGHASSGEARYIGKATRQRARQQELDTLNEKRTQLNQELKWLYGRLAQYEEQLTQVQEKQTHLRKVLAQSNLEEISVELSHVNMSLDEMTKKYQKARQQTQEVRQSYNVLLAQLERESQNIGPLAGDIKRVQGALVGVIKLKNQAKSVQVQLENITHTWEEYHKEQVAREQAQANEANVTRLYEQICHQAFQVQAEAQELQQIAEMANVEELGERLRELRELSERLSTQLDEAKAHTIRADERARNVESHLAEVEVQLQQALGERTERQQRFVDLLGAYPVEALAAAQQVASARNTISAARKLLGPTFREGDLQARKEQLESEYRDTYNALSRTFNREQSFLLEYGPNLDDQGHVLFLNENKSRPVDLLGILSDRIEMQRTLLGQEDRQLFEDFLLQEITEAIRTHILESEEWVQQINGVLSGLPMIGEHYSLQWKPEIEYDLAKPGGHLAQHYKLLRKPAQTLTTEETEILMGAFRQEIEAVRLRQQDNPDTNFMDALEEVFDYREWFHFDVLVTPLGGQRQRLTDRIAGTRSGAEQLFALYVPLFAALGALYRTAAPGAPRLLALDEAFDKVSVANTQRIMEFLVSQDFQWIMTGPQISGTGAKISACARYLMLHEKGLPFATASASFWSESQNLQEAEEN